MDEQTFAFIMLCTGFTLLGMGAGSLAVSLIYRRLYPQYTQTRTQYVLAIAAIIVGAALAGIIYS